MYKERYTPELTPIRAEYVVRPDVLRIPLTLSIDLEELAQALPLLQRTCEQFQRRLRDTLGTEFLFNPRDARFSRPAPNKLSLPEDDVTFASVMGTLEMALPTELDFWARGSRMGKVVRLCHEAERDTRHAKKLPRFSFGAVEALVARPEAHRTELLRRLVARARELADTVGASFAPLDVVDCASPGPVEQTAISMEEVGLSLNASYRLGVVRPLATTAPPHPG